MKYKISEDAFSTLDLLLEENESVDARPGSFISSNKRVNISGHSPNQGIFKAIGRSILTGKNFYTLRISSFQNETEVKLAPEILGHIQKLDINENQSFFTTDGSYLADIGNVEYKINFQNFKQGLFTASGFAILQFYGQGAVFINSFGKIITYDIKPNEELIIDNENILAWSNGVEYTLEKASHSWWSSIKSGENYVAKFRGSGVVYVQSHSLKRQTQAQLPYIPTSSS